MPSYLTLLFVGSLFSWLLYGVQHPGDVIQIKDLPKYLLFYYNYRGQGAWTFAHLWSICVEVHFYILLPLAFMVASRWLKHGSLILGVVALLVLGSWGSRLLGFAINFETMAASHNRFDALAFGVLLAGSFQMGLQKYFSRAMAYGVLLASIVLLLASIRIDRSSEVFDLTVFHTLAAISFTGVIGAVVLLNWRPHPIFSKIAAISFNWYLWHVIPLEFIKDHLGTGLLSFSVYFLTTLFAAILATRWIETPGLRLRKSFPFRSSVSLGSEPVLSSY